MKKTYWALGVIALIIIVSFLIRIFFVQKNTNDEGEKLAQQYCASCHMFPAPELLSKSFWEESVLPDMAFRMGFKDANIVSKIAPYDLKIVLESIPKEPILTYEELEKIRNYYLTNAPQVLPLQENDIHDTISLFTPSRSPFKKPFVTLLKFDSLHKQLYVGTNDGYLRILNEQQVVFDSVLLGSPPSDLKREQEQSWVALTGILDPNDQSKGSLVIVSNDGTAMSVIDSLKRPVYFSRGDLNMDGLQDIVVCAFGHYTGSLLIYESKGENNFSKHTLASTPGSRKVVIRDFDNDGLPDILALLTQGDERIILYKNKGDFNFEERMLLRFPPIYGSNFFELTDFNNDGHPDLLFTNGDNGDLSITIKPYHGVRIFENDGAMNFKESWFFPMPGAQQAMARDFDKDGDLDIAAISFFPDFEKHPERGFIYFENIGNDTFQPQTTAITALGRWLVMESGDYDSDGDSDIFLGASSYKSLGANDSIFQIWAKEKLPLLLLKNNLKR